MSRRNRWPALDDKGFYQKPTDAECDCCQQKAIGYVSVRWGPMRGSDIDTYPVCQRHLSMASDHAQFDKFIVHLRTKEKWLERKAERLGITP